MPNLDRAFIQGLMDPAQLARDLSNTQPQERVSRTGVTRAQYLDTLYKRYDQILGFPEGTTKDLWSDQHDDQASGNPALDQLIDFDQESDPVSSRIVNVINEMAADIERMQNLIRNHPDE